MEKYNFIVAFEIIKLIFLEILDVGGVHPSSIKIIHRKIIMVHSLINCKDLEEFIPNHHKKCNSHKKLKQKNFKNLAYKKSA